MERQDSSLQINNLWENKVTKNSNQVNFCVPHKIYNLQPYYIAELIKLIEYNDAEEKQDIENGEGFICFKKQTTIDTESIGDFFAEITKIGNKTINNIRQIFPRNILDTVDLLSKDQNKFWRYLFAVNENIVEDLDPKIINFYQENDKFGPHIKLQINNDTSIIRIKARTIYDLSKMINGLNQNIQSNY